MSIRHIIHFAFQGVFTFVNRSYIMSALTQAESTTAHSAIKTIEARIPGGDKKPGVYYAITSDGVELPVIDITHQVFAVQVTDARIQELVRRHVPSETLGVAFRQSILGSGFLGTSGGFLPGMSTYLLKLGEGVLDSRFGPIDRLIAQALVPTSLRLRLQDMAHLLADALIPLLVAKPERPLHLLNIAGGSAVDSLNALILIPKEHLKGRQIMIHVLDRDSSGPLFGKRALAALQVEGAPLEGLDIKYEYHQYNWAQTAGLQALIEGLSPSTSILAASSEGGLFEYGSDADIISNLAVLSPHVSCIVGSIIRADRQTLVGSHFSVHPRELNGFGALARQGGWTVDQVRTVPISYNVRLTKIA